MNEENGQHEFNFFLDKQIQQRLLDADDELDAKGALPPQTISNNKQKSSSNTNNSVHVSLVNNGNKNNNSQSQSKHLKEIQTLPLAGWCAESNITYRKAEGDGSSKTKGNAGVNNRESLVSRDTRHRPQASQDFVFRHYTDPRRYIEQYRREHVCYDTANSSATKSEFLDSRRFYAYNQYSPLAVCTQNGTFQQSTTLPPSQQESSFGQASEQQPQSLPKPPHTPTIHYTTRKDQSKQMLHATLRSNSQQKHKLSNTPGSKSETTQIFDKSSEVPEKFDSREHSKRAGSAKDGASSPAINGLSLQKAAASKVNVPSSNSGVVSARNLRHQRSRSPSDPNLSNQFVSHKLGPSSSGSSRTLDTLACVAGSAGEKQPTTPANPRASIDTNNNNHNHIHNNTNNNNSKSSTSSNNRGGSTMTRNSKLSTAGKNRTQTVPTNSNDRTKNDSSASPFPALVRNDAFASPYPPVTNTRNDSSVSPYPTHTKADAHSSSYPSLTNGGSTYTTSCSGVHGQDLPLDSGHVSDSADDSDSAVSIGRLSTTCLGVEATVKQRPKLEASCTYHVFPNEFIINASPGFSPALVWNPAKSSLDKRAVVGAHLDPGLASPFRSSPRTRPSTEEGQRNVEFITKEFVPDAKPLNLCPDIFRNSSRLSNPSPGLKANTIKPDLPPTFQLQGFSKRSHFETLRKKRGLSKTAGARRKKDVKDGGSRKSWSASTDTSSSTGNAMKLKPVTTAELLKSQGLDGGGGQNNTSSSGVMTVPSLGPVPYFKFWNSSLPPKSREGRGARRDKTSDLNLQQLAELVLADENGRKDRDLAEAAKKVLEQQQKLETDQQATAGIATGNSGLQETLVASSQARLESFRHVNKKRTPKLRPPQLQLKFFGQDRTRSPQLSSQPDCRRMSRSLQQPLRCSPDHDPLLININNNADDTTIGGDDVDEDGVNEENNTDGGRYVKKSVKGAADLNVTSEHPSWKERSLMAMKEQDKKHPHMFYDRWAVAKKNEERMLISHKRRIKHLMEQSRLKSKFGQLLSQVSDTATKKTTMEVPSIHISDPFMVAEANTDANCNNSNVRRSDMSVKDHVQGTHSNEGISYRDDDGENYGDNSVISSFEENIIFQYRQNPEHNKSQCNRLEAGDAASYQILDEWERILPKTLKREFDSHTKKGYSKKHDHEFAGVDFFSHFHTTQDATSKTPLKQVTFNNKLGNSLCVERNDDSGPSGKNNSVFSSVNKRMGKLAEQMSATVSFRVPKFKYSSLTELNRSQTMNL